MEAGFGFEFIRTDAESRCFDKHGVGTHTGENEGTKEGETRRSNADGRTQRSPRFLSGFVASHPPARKQLNVGRLVHRHHATSAINHRQQERVDGKACFEIFQLLPILQRVFFSTQTIENI